MDIKISLHLEDLPQNIQLAGDLAIDTEAMGLEIVRDRLCLVQIKDETDNVHLVQFKKNSKYNAPVLRSYLEDGSRKKIFHFARFDVAILKYYLNIQHIQNIFCTKIASRFVRTYTNHHGLKSLVSELLGVDIKKDQQTSHWGRSELTNAQKRYAACDVYYLHALKNKLVEMLQEENRLGIAQHYCNFIDNVATADIMGFHYDMFAHEYK